MPSVTLFRPFSLFLMASQFDDHLVRAVGVDVAEHVRVAVHQLVVHPARDVGQVELALLVGQAGVEDDLEQQVAQLLLQVRVAAPSGVARRVAAPTARRGPRSTPRRGGASARRGSAPGPTGSARAACP